MLYDSQAPEDDFKAANAEFTDVYQATADGRETVFTKRHKSAANEKVA
jgi:hypothetical protein